MTEKQAKSLAPKRRSSRSSVKTKHGCPILEVVHRTARDFPAAGVMDKKTMRRFDVTCLTPVKPLTPRQIARIRRQEDVSQAVFALHLGVSLNPISQWERREKKPSGASLKLLTLVEKNGLDWVA